MPDVEITYNNSTIASLSDSGTEVLETNGKLCSDDITVAYTRTNGSATTPATTITANPTISVSNTGAIIATVGKSQSVTPTVSAGYVSSGTAGTITVSGSNTYQLTTQAAQTITPTTTNQTIASGKYLTGTQTILGDANLLAENIKKDVSLFNIVGTYEGSGGGFSIVTATASGTGSAYLDFNIGVFNKSPSVVFCYIKSPNSITVSTLTGSAMAVSGVYIVGNDDPFMPTPPTTRGNGLTSTTYSTNYGSSFSYNSSTGVLQFRCGSLVFKSGVTYSLVVVI